MLLLTEIIQVTIHCSQMKICPPTPPPPKKEKTSLLFLLYPGFRAYTVGSLLQLAVRVRAGGWGVEGDENVTSKCQSVFLPPLHSKSLLTTTKPFSSSLLYWWRPSWHYSKEQEVSNTFY